MKKSIATVATVATACAVALAATLGAAALATPALANDGTEQAMGYADAGAPHYEGERVTIGDDWGQPVYAEWHRGDSGRWWAMFWTYNYTRVYAEPAAAGCGWAFHAYGRDGSWVTLYRTEESSSYGQVGPQGVSSHWQDGDGNWY